MAAKLPPRHEDDQGESSFIDESLLKQEYLERTLSAVRRERFLRVGGRIGALDLLEFPAFKKLEDAERAAKRRAEEAQREPVREESPADAEEADTEAEPPPQPDEPSPPRIDPGELMAIVEEMGRALEEPPPDELPDDTLLVHDPYNSEWNREEAIESLPAGEIPLLPEHTVAREYHFYEDDL